MTPLEKIIEATAKIMRVETSDIVAGVTGRNRFTKKQIRAKRLTVYVAKRDGHSWRKIARALGYRHKSPDTSTIRYYHQSFEELDYDNWLQEMYYVTAIEKELKITSPEHQIARPGIDLDHV